MSFYSSVFQTVFKRERDPKKYRIEWERTDRQTDREADPPPNRIVSLTRTLPKVLNL